MKNNPDFLAYRKLLLIFLLVLIPVGLMTKFVHGRGTSWINHYAGGIIYELFWCLFISFLNPRSKGFSIAVWIFIVTCLLECLQLWHPSFLESIRSTFLGKALIGTSFSWWDFPHYVIGSFCGGLLIEKLKKRCIPQFK